MSRRNVRIVRGVDSDKVNEKERKRRKEKDVERSCRVNSKRE